MRQKRAKQYKKQMNVYHHAFKFRAPYQVICDDAIVLEASRTSFDVEKGLRNSVQDEIKPMITQCCIQSLYKSKEDKAINLAKRFERRRCNHDYRNPLSPYDCINSVVNVNGHNKHRYIVITQDERLKQKLRTVPGVPLFYINRSVLIMEPLSGASEKFSTSVENAKLTKGLNDSGRVEKKVAPKKRKGPKEPNPLSIKKRKNESEEKQDDGKKKRKRRHKKSGEEPSKVDEGGKEEGDKEEKENVDSGEL